MKNYLALSLLSAAIILMSCGKGKNSNNSTTSIQGTYKLMYLSSKTNSTISGNDGEKSITTSDYTTTDNQGTIVFSNSTLTSAGLTYTVNTDARYSFFQDNLLTDSSSIPFTFTLPASSSVASYKLVGADSIYFPQGSVTSGIGAGGTMQSGANGGRYSISGNQLTLTQNGYRDSSFVDTGVTFQVVESAISTIVLQKQ
jgi:hypothetical protein